MADEFYHLIPRKKDEPKPEVKKEREKKVKPPKFKKGGWKHWLYKKLKGWKSCKYVEQFHFTKRSNILIACESDPEVMFFNHKVGKGTIKKLQKLAGKENVFVLIDAYDQVYVKFPVKSYLKLMEIDKMIISFRLRANNDDIEIVDVYEDEVVITNINDLAAYINHFRQGIEGVYEIQANCCCFTYYEFKVKIVVMKTDGSVETYKGDMNDFMKEYGLHQF